jgi:peptidoglycan hydrolase-like protein with peptidoglycan-binding domain
MENNTNNSGTKKIIIAIVIIFIVIIIGVVGYLIYKSNKKKKDDLASQQMAILQQQLESGNVPPQQKAGLLAQIAALAAQIKNANQDISTPPYVSGIYAPPAGSASSSIPDTTPSPAGFPLKKGSNTSKAPINYVKSLQAAINVKCNQKLVTDGVFGPKTESAVISCLGTPTVSFQQYQQLSLLI